MYLKMGQSVKIFSYVKVKNFVLYLIMGFAITSITLLAVIKAEADLALSLFIYG